MWSLYGCWQVIYTESLTSPAEDEDPLCQSVPVTGLQAAVFIPTQPSRLAVVHNQRQANKKILSVFDVSLKKSKYKSEIQGKCPDDPTVVQLKILFKSPLVTVQQVESFTLNTSSSQILLEAKNSNCLLLATNQELLVYSLKGALLASFKEHTMPISSMCVVGCFPPVTSWMVNSFHFMFRHLKISVSSRTASGS